MPLGAKGIATRSKDATRGSWFQGETTRPTFSKAPVAWGSGHLATGLLADVLGMIEGDPGTHRDESCPKHRMS